MINQTKSLGAYMDAANSRPSGFDYMRLGLALAVVVGHCYNTSNGRDAAQALWATFPFGGIHSSILPMFFALSGFLVAGSMERSKTVVKFLGLRFVRIYPALMVEVVLTAFLIGPFVTALPLAEYFTDPGFLRYLINVTGHITIHLPEVFLGNPRPEVANEQLWTVPFELYCYAALGLLIVIGAKRDRRIVMAGTIVIFALVLLRIGIKNNWVFPDWEGPVSGYMLVVSFLIGVCLYLYRYEIPCSPLLAVGVGVLTLLTFHYAPQDRIVGCFPAAYLTVMMGVFNPKRNALVDGADFSYGIYLYHYVILQTVIYIFGGTLAWYWTFLISFPLIVAFAAFSWFVIEKPALKLKKKLDPAEQWYLRRRKGPDAPAAEPD